MISNRIGMSVLWTEQLRQVTQFHVASSKRWPILIGISINDYRNRGPAEITGAQCHYFRLFAFRFKIINFRWFFFCVISKWIRLRFENSSLKFSNKIIKIFEMPVKLPKSESSRTRKAKTNRNGMCSLAFDRDRIKRNRQRDKQVCNDGFVCGTALQWDRSRKWPSNGRTWVILSTHAIHIVSDEFSLADMWFVSPLERWSTLKWHTDTHSHTRTHRHRPDFFFITNACCGGIGAVCWQNNNNAMLLNALPTGIPLLVFANISSFLFWCQNYAVVVVVLF